MAGIEILITKRDWNVNEFKCWDKLKNKRYIAALRQWWLFERLSGFLLMNLKLPLIYFILIILSFKAIYADANDELRKKIDTASPKVQLMLYNELAEKVSSDSLTQSLEYALKALDISGIIYWREGEAITRLTLAKIQITGSYLKEAFSNSIIAANIFQELAIPQKAADAKFYAAKAAAALSRTDTAEVLYKSAIDFYIKSGDKFHSGLSRLELGKLLSDLRKNTITLDSSRILIRDAMQLFINNNRPEYIAESYIDLALSYLYDKRDTHSKDSSLKYYEKARQIYEEHKDSLNIANFYYGYAEILKALGDTKNAGNYYEKALSLFKNKNDIEGQKQTLQGLYKISASAGSAASFKLAMEYLEQYTKIIDQQLTENIEQRDLEKRINFEELQRKRVEKELSKVETEKRLTELQREKAKASFKMMTIFSVALIIIVFLLIMIAFILRRFYNQKKKSNKLLEETNNKISEVNKNLAEKSAKIEKQNMIIEHDLDKAADYVKSILPKITDFGSICTEWKFVPSAHLGGDLFGYGLIDDTHFMFYLIDVAGHGVKSALYSVSVGNVLNYKNLPGVDFRNPVQVFHGLNSAFQMKDHNDLFFTIWYGVYDTATKILKYSSAGHPPALMLYGNEYHRLACDNFLIGGLPEFPFESNSLLIEEKTDIVIYSDGAYEIMKDDGEYWTLDEFAEKIDRLEKSGECTTEKIFSEISSISGESSLADDFSVLKITIN